MSGWMNGMKIVYKVFPCKGCDKRHPHCHTYCEEYLAAQVKNDELREERQRIANTERIADDRRRR